MQRWVDPKGKPFHVAADELREFCTRRGLNASNMEEHVKRPASDQKNGGYRLISRLRFIQSEEDPTLIVPALGTLDAFYNDCMDAHDGREKLVNPDNLRKLLAGSYNGGGKPYNGWKKTTMTVDEAECLLLERYEKMVSSASFPHRSSAHCLTNLPLLLRLPPLAARTRPALAPRSLRAIM